MFGFFLKVEGMFLVVLLMIMFFFFWGGVFFDDLGYVFDSFARLPWLFTRCA